MFSIITPSFNRNDTIHKAVGSIVGQQGIEREHIVQDNCSGDGTVAFLERQFSRSSMPENCDYTFNYISEPDSGMYDAINRGWSRATGEVLSWLNCDEQYLPGTLEKVKAIFDARPEIDVVCGNFICVDDKGHAIAARREIRASYNYMKYCTCYIASCTTFYRRRLRDKGLLILDDSYKLSADRELLLKLLKHKIKFYRMPEYLALFMVTEQNLSARYQEEMKIEDRSIDRSYGVNKLDVKKYLIKPFRYVEKLFSGAYCKVDGSYEYTEDELGSTTRQSFGTLSYKHTFN